MVGAVCLNYVGDKLIVATQPTDGFAMLCDETRKKRDKFGANSVL